MRYSFSTSSLDFRITGVLKNPPANTFRDQEIYVSYRNLKERSPRLGDDNNWGTVSSNMQCYILLKPGTTKANAEKSAARVQ
ncbi:MAG: ABC transporter permease [Bacteroidota bacterium]